MISIIPRPKELDLQDGELRLSLPLIIHGDRATHAARRYLEDLFGDRVSLSADPATAHLLLFCEEALMGECGREGYLLTISPEGATLRAAGSAGLLYGLQTLRQLLPADLISLASDDQVSLPCLSITDLPRYRWRGFMLDEARHFFGTRTVKRVLDWMAFLKLNVFHWHLTDYQGWRLEIERYPLLTEIGGRRRGSQIGTFRGKYCGMDWTPHEGWYTQEEIRQLVAYAAERNIQIVPELDLPGHFTAALAAYPHLGCTKEPMEVRCRYGVFQDVACVGDPQTRTFLRQVLDEVCDLFPGPYIHLGGDEVKTDSWANCPACRQERATHKLQHLADLTTHLMNQLASHLAGHNKTAVVWNEALRAFLDQEVVVMHWTPVPSSMNRTRQALRDGYQVVFQTFFESYLDYPHTMVPLKRVYRARSLGRMTPQMQNNVLGTQAALWTEFVEDEDRIQWQAFPRLAAKAEAAWSSADHHNYRRFQERWAGLLDHLAVMGLTNPAPLAICNPGLFRRWWHTYRDLRRDMQGEQKRHSH